MPAVVEGVLLLHGLCRTPRSMRRLAAALRCEGWLVHAPAYPSRALSIPVLAEQVVGAGLASPVLAACGRVHVVGHSLGGILVRAWATRHDDPRLGRVVQLGPPNQGSEIVDRIGHWATFRWLNGKAGQELGTGPGSVPLALGPTRLDLGVIAGNRSINPINSLVLLPGPDDGKVTVARTHVQGERDHVVLPVAHPFLMTDPRAIAQVIHFLQRGAFRP